MRGSRVACGSCGGATGMPDAGRRAGWVLYERGEVRPFALTQPRRRATRARAEDEEDGPSCAGRRGSRMGGLGPGGRNACVPGRAAPSWGGAGENGQDLGANGENAMHHGHGQGILSLAGGELRLLALDELVDGALWQPLHRHLDGAQVCRHVLLYAPLQGRHGHHAPRRHVHRVDKLGGVLRHLRGRRLIARRRCRQVRGRGRHHSP
mmetsp:Transcript_384/g.1090  ORF Transcript_384/g.1090 Transcript_384/m.1090 type:complete len:208 (+) Transcript_384:146-769(+)